MTEQTLSPGKNPCPDCGSNNNLTLHPDGGIWCYSMPECPGNKGRKQPPGFVNRLNPRDFTPIPNIRSGELIDGVFGPLMHRRISKKTCEFFNYQTGLYNGLSVEIANYGQDCQQIRTKDKNFKFIGDTSKLTLWGKEKWSNNSRNIIITEGQIDCMSIAEAQDCKWPVVSLPNGASSAKKSLEGELDWLLGFESIILCFDNDEAGVAARESVIHLFPPGKLKISSLSEKDANDCLVKGKHEELIRIPFTAQEYRPDGIIWGHELNWQEFRKPKPRGLSIPYPILDDMIRGLKDSRIYTVYAGTGLGKSTFLKEIGFWVRKKYPEILIANIFLEEGLEFTATAYKAMYWNYPEYKLEEDPNLLSADQHEEAERFCDGFGFYKHFGSLDSKRLFNLLDYLAVVKGVKIILLDHISIIVSGLESSGEGERKDIDILMTRLRQFCERTKCRIICATQLKRKKGSYSEGEVITEADSRGSGVIEHISDVIVSLNVDTSSGNPYDAQLKINKNRITGRKGDADLITYDFETGRYLPKKLADKSDTGTMY
ncbi:MAG TPA: DnaB-like helicase C-terminal domain-containing protein [Nitrososphaeraceae archaeon]